MSLAGRYLEVDFGVANTGLATVGYTLYNAAGGVVVARTTTGVSERGASGVYGVTVPTILDTVASIVWDTGVGSPEYASEDVIAALSANDGSYEDGAVWVDDVDGSDSNSGTEKNPKASVDAAWTVAQAVGLKRLRILLDASYTMTQGFEYATFVGSSPEFATINVGGQDSWGCVFRRCGLGGTWGSGGEWNRAYECEVAALLNIADLTLYDCRIGSTLQVRVGNGVELINCYNEIGVQATPGVTFDYPVGGTGIFRAVGLSAHVSLTNMSGVNANAVLNFSRGSVTVDSTCTDGTVTISGTCTLIDNSGVGCTIVDNRTVVDNAAYLETDGPNPHGTGAWDASAVPPQTIRDAMKLAPTGGAPAGGSVDEHLDTIEADTAAMQPLVDVAVSTRSSHDAADVDTQLTGTHGAGLWETAASCFDAIYCDPNNGNDLDPGTPTQPVQTLAQAITLAGSSLVPKIILESPTLISGAVLAVDPGTIRIESNNPLHSINITAATLTGTVFERVGIVGTSMTAGVTPPVFRQCGFTNTSGLEGQFSDCTFYGTNVIGGACNMLRCKTLGTAVIDLNGGTAAAVNFVGLSGTLEFTNCATVSQIVAVSADSSSTVTLDATISNIICALSGDMLLIDNKTGGFLQDDRQVKQIDVELTAQHDAGSWGGTTAQDIRDSMKLAPTGGAPAGGSVDEHLDTIEADTASIEPLVTANLDAQVSLVETDVAAAARAATDVGEHNATQAAIAALNNPTTAAIADAVLREVVSDHSGVAGSLADLVAFIHDIEGGRWRIDTGADQMVFYKADNVTVVATMDLKDLAGNPTSSPSSVTERTRV